MSENAAWATDVVREGSGEIALWDWIILDHGRKLHAPKRWDDPHYNASDGNAETVCGKTGLGMIPGAFTRMGAKRCGACCQLTGYPAGKGSPKNDDTCRPLVEAMLACS